MNSVKIKFVIKYPCVRNYYVIIIVSNNPSDICLTNTLIFYLWKFILSNIHNKQENDINLKMPLVATLKIKIKIKKI